jgi:hypothetical protein
MRCTSCFRMNDTHTPVDGAAGGPAPGSISICAYCGNVSVFTDDLRLRTMTMNELMDLGRKDPNGYRKVITAVGVIKKRNGLN